jgi:hypothetical protein
MCVVWPNVSTLAQSLTGPRKRHPVIGSTSDAYDRLGARRPAAGQILGSVTYYRMRDMQPCLGEMRYAHYRGECSRGH